MRNLLATRALRRGDGVVSMPESRRNERLFGTTGGGRTKSASMGIKLENLEKDYDPRSDTCLKAFVPALSACVHCLLVSYSQLRSQSPLLVRQQPLDSEHDLELVACQSMCSIYAFIY